MLRETFHTKHTNQIKSNPRTDKIKLTGRIGTPKSNWDVFPINLNRFYESVMHPGQRQCQEEIHDVGKCQNCKITVKITELIMYYKYTVL